jgi:hypothetical protein
MPFLGGLAGLAMLLCAVHAVRSGRSQYWLWIILMVPGFGAAVYFVAEMLPDLLHGRSVHQMSHHLIELVVPGRSLRQLEEEVAVSDTVKNRQLLARAYVSAGRYADAIQQYDQCLQGVFKDDPPTVLELAYAHFLNGDYPAARQWLERLEQVHPRFRTQERQLLLARTLEQADDVEGALCAYETMVKTSSGEETRCRYAMLLERAGQTDKAAEIYREILARAKRSPGYYRRDQRAWIKIARQNLARQAQG